MRKQAFRLLTCLYNTVIEPISTKADSADAQFDLNTLNSLTTSIFDIDHEKESKSIATVVLQTGSIYLQTFS